MNWKRYITAFLFVFTLLNGANAQRYLDNAIRRPDDHRNEIRLGLRAGLNLSDLTSAQGLDVWNGLAYWDINKNYIGFTDTRSRIGFNAGLTAQLKLVDRWYVQASLIWTTKGYKLNSQQVEIDAQAHYIQLPVEMIYKYPVKDVDLLVSAGLFLGVGVFGQTSFFDHYGQYDEPRLFHTAVQEPFIDEEHGTYNLIGCDFTVHGANDYWADDDDTFLSSGTYKIDGGVQVGLGLEWKQFQFMLSYQFSLTYLYNYNYDFSGRYTEKGQPYHNSWEYFNMDVPTCPRQHVLSFTVSYFFDKWKHGLKL